MRWTRGKNKHSPPFLTRHLTPHFAPSPHSRENKIREQDARTERAEAPPPRLRRVAREGTPPTFCPTFCPTHARTGRASGKRRGPASSFAQEARKGTPPSFSPTHGTAGRANGARSPHPFRPPPSIARKGGTTVPPSPIAPNPHSHENPTRQRARRDPAPRWCPPVCHVHRGLLPLSRAGPLHANGMCEEGGGIAPRTAFARAPPSPFFSVRSILRAPPSSLHVWPVFAHYPPPLSACAAFATRSERGVDANRGGGGTACPPATARPSPFSRHLAPVRERGVQRGCTNDERGAGQHPKGTPPTLTPHPPPLSPLTNRACERRTDLPPLAPADHSGNARRDPRSTAPCPTNGGFPPPPSRTRQGSTRVRGTARPLPSRTPGRQSRGGRAGCRGGGEASSQVTRTPLRTPLCPLAHEWGGAWSQSGGTAPSRTRRPRVPAAARRPLTQRPQQLHRGLPRDVGPPSRMRRPRAVPAAVRRGPMCLEGPTGTGCP